MTNSIAQLTLLLVKKVEKEKSLCLKKEATAYSS